MSDTLSQDGFVETVGTALERLRQYAPEIEWVLEEDGSIVVWLDAA